MLRINLKQWSDTNCLLQLAAEHRDGALFALALVTDPERRALAHFFACSGERAEHDPSAAWLAGLHALAAKATRGQIDPANPWPAVRAVLATRACKFARQEEANRDPRMPGPAGRRKRLFVQPDVLDLAGSRLESKAEEGQWTAKLAENNRAFEVGIDPVDLEVFRRVSEYTAANNGSDHGALTAVAATARLDAGGKLVLPAGGEPTAPDRHKLRVYAAVRKAYLRAKAEVVRILEANGVEVHPSLK